MRKTVAELLYEAITLLVCGNLSETERVLEILLYGLQEDALSIPVDEAQALKHRDEVYKHQGAEGVDCD